MNTTDEFSHKTKIVLIWYVYCECCEHDLRVGEAGIVAQLIATKHVNASAYSRWEER